MAMSLIQLNAFLAEKQTEVCQIRAKHHLLQINILKKLLAIGKHLRRLLLT
jgi:hypothetical protein